MKIAIIGSRNLRLDNLEKYLPIKRNDEIIEYADIVYAFWNGKSRGTKYVIENCKKKGKQVRIFLWQENHKK